MPRDSATHHGSQVGGPPVGSQEKIIGPRHCPGRLSMAASASPRLSAVRLVCRTMAATGVIVPAMPARWARRCLHAN
jgi:hypothetical protein